MRCKNGGSAGEESACSAGDLGSIPGLGRSPGERKRLPTPVFGPGEFHGLYSLWGCKQPDVTKRLSHLYIPNCLGVYISLSTFFPVHVNVLFTHMIYDCVQEHL